MSKPEPDSVVAVQEKVSCPREKQLEEKSNELWTFSEFLNSEWRYKIFLLKEFKIRDSLIKTKFFPADMLVFFDTRQVFYISGRSNSVTAHFGEVKNAFLTPKNYFLPHISENATPLGNLVVKSEKGTLLVLRVDLQNDQWTFGHISLGLAELRARIQTFVNLSPFHILTALTGKISDASAELVRLAGSSPLIYAVHWNTVPLTECLNSTLATKSQSNGTHAVVHNTIAELVLKVHGGQIMTETPNVNSAVTTMASTHVRGEYVHKKFGRVSKLTIDKIASNCGRTLFTESSNQECSSSTVTSSGGQKSSQTSKRTAAKQREKLVRLTSPLVQWQSRDKENVPHLERPGGGNAQC
jgi:hypothetical protein